MKNWKTTLSGILTVAILVAGQAWPKIVTVEVQTSITTLLVAAGLLAAKDHNVTGGKVEQ